MRWLMPTVTVLCLVSLGAVIWFGVITAGPDAAVPGVIQAEAAAPEMNAAAERPSASKRSTPAAKTPSNDRRDSTSPARRRSQSSAVATAALALLRNTASTPAASDAVRGDSVDESRAPETLLETNSGRPSVIARTAPQDSTAMIYSRNDVDVQPPVMQQPALPPSAFAGTAPDSLVNRMELLIAPDGTVERVRLLNAPTRMPDMMLLSGAKVWKFTPALKDGIPVRYRTTVTWTGFP
jgi:hypothetical protein